MADLETSHATLDHTGLTGVGGGGGSDLVQVASGAGSVRIPGIGYADRVPASPNAKDDEFDTTSTFSSTLGSLDTNNTTDVHSHLHMVKTSTASQALYGVYKTAPSFPFTVTAKLSAFLASAAYQTYYIMLGPTSPGALACFGLTVPFTGNYVDPEYSVWSSSTSRSSVTTYNTSAFASSRYLRIVATSTSSLAVAVSYDGYIWRTLGTGLNPGITITTVGLVVGSATNVVTAEALWDWVRFS